MTSLYLDSDVSVHVAGFLRAAGHDAVTTEELGLRRATDDQQLLVASQQGRVMVTHNRKDFVLLHDAWRRWAAAWGFLTAPAHPGILVLDHRPESELAAAVSAFLAAISPVPTTTALYWWRHTSGWHVQLSDRQWVLYR